MGPSYRDRPVVVPPARSEGRARLRLVEDSDGIGFVEIVEAFCGFRILGAWAELRRLLDDDARLESLAAAGVAGPGETVQAIRFAAAAEAGATLEYEVTPLGADAAVVRATVDRGAAAGTAPAVHHWLLTARNGLIWRARIVPSFADAALMLGALGPGLGL